jgi:hypothetical protein
MAEKAGLFKWIRETSFLKFVIAWTLSIFAFTILYWVMAFIRPGLSIHGSEIMPTLMGLIESLYASFLTATVFGVVQVSFSGVYTPIIYLQVLFSGLVMLALIDKLLQTYIFPHYHVRHTQDKKINTMLLTMSIFRNDIDKIRAEFRSKSRHHVNIKEIESVIDGLYVTFLDIEKMFSARNTNKHNITDYQHTLVIINIEDSLHKLSKFIDFLKDHKIEWKDKNVDFWIRYILESADKVTLHFDDVKIKNPKLIIAIENIKELTQDIEKKL